MAPTMPFGLRDLAVTPLGAAGDTPGTKVDLPKAQRLSFAEAEDFEVLRGDDREQDRRGKGPIVNWSMNAGGLPLDAAKAMVGGTLTTSGTGATAKDTLSKTTLDQRPWFKIEGQSLSEAGGDQHTVIYRCLVTGDFAGEMADGAYWVSGFTGIGLGSLEVGSLNKLWDIVHNTTAAAIP